MQQDLTLEEVLRARAEAGRDEDARDFWDRYSSAKRYLSDNYYGWIQANCPFYTDHGEQHIRSVNQSASELLRRNLSVEPNDSLTTLDLFLVLSAILWHDVGNVFKRSGHAQRIGEMTDQVRTLAFPGLPIQRLVIDIARAHAGTGASNGLSLPREDDDCATRNKNYRVYPRALAAIVRFADEISDNHTRISAALIDDVIDGKPALPSENRIYWEYARSIAASVADPERSRVIVRADMSIDKAVQEHSCSEFSPLHSSAGNITLVEYFFHRIEKVNNERAYCNRYMARIGTVREIEIRLRLLKGHEPVAGYESLNEIIGDGALKQEHYPAIRVVDQIFSRR